MAWKCHSFNWEITNYFSASCYCATSESINLQKELNKKTWSGEKFRIGIANANRKPFHRQFFSWRHAAKVISDRPTCRFFIFRRVFFFSSALNSFFYTQRERKKKHFICAKWRELCKFDVTARATSGSRNWRISHVHPHPSYFFFSFYRRKKLEPHLCTWNDESFKSSDLK